MEFAAFAAWADECESADADLRITATVAEALRDADAELPIVARFLQGRIFPGHDGRNVSIGSTLLHETIARAAGEGVSAADIEDRLAETGEIGAVAAEFDFRDGGQTGLGAFGAGGVDPLTVREVSEAFESMAAAEGTGSESVRRDTLFGLFTRASPSEAKYLARLVKGTMRIGVGSGTVRDAISEAFLGVPVSAGADGGDGGADASDDARTADAAATADDGQTTLGATADTDDATADTDDATADTDDATADTDDATADASEPTDTGDTDTSDEEATGSEEREYTDEEATAAVARALQVTNDYGRVARITRESGIDGLREVGLEIGRPVQAMLAQAGGGQDAVDEWGRAVVDTKFDGARVQIHYDGSEVSIYSRRMENVTAALPEVVEHAETHLTAPAIVDGECVAVDEAGDPLPFQEILRRFRRKHDVDRMREEVAVQLRAFDCLHADGDDLLDTPLVERRERLDAVSTAGVADYETVTEPAALDRLERDALAAGHEGLMVKNPDSAYTPGSRGGDWLKRKPEVETLDLAVVGAEWGEGRRANLFGTYVLAARVPENAVEATGDDSGAPTDDDSAANADTQIPPLPDDPEHGEIAGEGGRFRPVGKVATGFTDEELAAVTERVESHVREETGTELRVDPRVVFEVGYEEIQRSPTYAAGYALRFPRFLGVREDVGPSDADSVARVRRLAEE